MRRATQIIILATIALLVAYDVVAVVVGGGAATISRVVLEASQRWPLIPFAGGVLCGHLFWPMRTPSESSE